MQKTIKSIPVIMTDFDGIYRMSENGEEIIEKVYTIPGLEDPLHQIKTDFQNRENSGIGN